MWMQLGCRAFVKGAKKTLLRREDDVGEPTIRISDDGTDESSNKQFACDQIQLPSGEDGNGNKFDGIYLTNPSMNELIRTIHTALSVDQYRGIIVAGQNTRENYEISHLQTAPTNFRIQNACSKGYQNGKDLVLKRRTVSFDDLRQLKQLDTWEPQLWRVRSEGNLIEQRNLVFDPRFYQSKYAVSCDNTSILNSESISSFTSISRDCSCECTSETDFEDQLDFSSVALKRVTPMMPQDVLTEFPKWQLPQNSNICCWINLAHFLLVIACLRGLL
ncbi:uncharacterized protein LOC119556791 isoform X1 [Drosophila subpulchrella]|uniref:uncharacterized protein LOC119556791 isoform X1 n=1 Tax=Drosophila subpulchrella TaxID=1486046 RepID=UPI0018A19896|nr:uncharacterized protein LOC119556791 isoform X1 [Drosophila subpulchrella]